MLPLKSRARFCFQLSVELGLIKREPGADRKLGVQSLLNSTKSLPQSALKMLAGRQMRCVTAVVVIWLREERKVNWEVKNSR